MDTTMIIFIALAIIIVIAVILLVFLGGKKQPQQNNEEIENKNSTTAKRFQQVLTDDDSLDKEMSNKANEILTQYTSGTGEGISEVEKLLEGDPNNVDLLDWLAFMYYSNNNIDKAIETYKRALSIKADNENQHYYLGNSYFKKNMMAEAKKSWNEVIRLNPGSKIAKNAQERINYLSSQGK